jgi:surface antigen
MVAALGLVSTSLTGTVTCHTTYDGSLQHLVTPCRNGSRAVTRDDDERSHRLGATGGADGHKEVRQQEEGV